MIWKTYSIKFNFSSYELILLKYNVKPYVGTPDLTTVAPPATVKPPEIEQGTNIK